MRNTGQATAAASVTEPMAAVVQERYGTEPEAVLRNFRPNVTGELSTASGGVLVGFQMLRLALLVTVKVQLNVETSALVEVSFTPEAPLLTRAV